MVNQYIFITSMQINAKTQVSTTLLKMQKLQYVAIIFFQL